MNRRLGRRNWQGFLDEQIREFVEHEAEDNIARGMSPEAARQAALRKFGNVTRVKEETRAVWTMIWLKQFLQDAVYGLRMVMRNLGFSAAVMLTLALGIGMTSAMFSVMDAVLFRHVSYPDAQRLVWVANYDTGWESEQDVQVLPADYAAFRDQARSFESLTAYYNGDLAVVYHGGGSAERIAWVSGEFWRTTGAHPALGRLFGAGEPREIVLTWELYQRRFGADPSILGQTVSIGGHTFAIAGVLPPRFRLQFPQFLYPDDERKEIDPYIAVPDEAYHLPMTAYRGANWDKVQEDFGPLPPFVWIVGKLQPNVSFERMRSELEVIHQRVTRESPGFYHTHRALRVQPLQSKLAGNARPALLVLGGAVGFVLLIVCANIANLLLARATSRQREVAIRRALGAGVARLVRQFLAESAIFAAAGVVAGAALARAIVVVVTRIGSGVVPRLADAAIDGRVLLFATAASLLSVVLFGFGPAASLLRGDTQRPLKEDARGSSVSLGRLRIRASLAALEVAMAIVLLSGAGLMLRSFWRMSILPPGNAPDKILTMKISLTGARYNSWLQQHAYLDELLRRMAAIRGVEAVGVHCSTLNTTIQLEGGGADQSTPAAIEYVSPGYLRAIGVPVLDGQWPGENELDAVMINQSLERQLQSGSVIGKGARRADVAAMVMRQGLSIVGIGVATGILGALGLGRVLTGLLYGVKPNDPPNDSGCRGLTHDSRFACVLGTVVEGRPGGPDRCGSLRVAIESERASGSNVNTNDPPGTGLAASLCR